jgi:outer membrane lipoprotein carrier protein
MKPMKPKWMMAGIVWLTWLFFMAPTLSAVRAADAGLALEEILDRVEKRYSGDGFTADFMQESTIKAMKITDFARGRVFVKYPGQMRWEYQEPEPQIIITDGIKLWIYRPEDNQVMTGNAPVFFRDGKGASFLSDVKIIREKFNIAMDTTSEELFYRFTLFPREKTLDITEIRMAVDKKDYTITRIVTVNQYEDVTHIELINHRFDVNLDDSLFSFKVPEGVDELKIDEQ